MPPLTPNAKKVIGDLTILWKNSDALKTSASNELLYHLRKAEIRAFRRMETIIGEYGGLYKVTLDKRAAWYVSNLANIEKALSESFPGQALDGYVDRYKEWGKFASQSIALGGNVPSEFTTIPKKWIDFIAARDKSFMEGILKGDARQALDKAFLDNVVSGVSPSTLRSSIKGIITGSYPWGKRTGLYEWHAGTYVRTLHRRASRQFHVQQAKEAGLQHYLYLGPLDSKTRTFCQPLVGGVYTEAQINEMDNGQSGSGAGIVLQDGGGFNCRHDWVAVGKEFAKELGDAAGDASTSPPPKPKPKPSPKPRPKKAKPKPPPGPSYKPKPKPSPTSSYNPVQSEIAKKIPAGSLPKTTGASPGQLMANEAWINSLTTNEVEAITAWKRGSGPFRRYQLARHRGKEAIAAYEREIGRAAVEYNRKIVETIENSVNRAKPYRSPHAIYRGLSQVPKATLDEWLSSGVAEFNNMGSSSKLLTEARKFAGRTQGPDSNSVIFVIKGNKSAVDIQKIDGYYSEAEVLLRENKVYKILGDPAPAFRDGRTYIYVKEAK